jgi:hypothetical protein
MKKRRKNKKKRLYKRIVQVSIINGFYVVQRLSPVTDPQVAVVLMIGPGPFSLVQE